MDVHWGEPLACSTPHCDALRRSTGCALHLHRHRRGGEAAPEGLLRPRFPQAGGGGAGGSVEEPGGAERCASCRAFWLRLLPVADRALLSCPATGLIQTES